MTLNIATITDSLSNLSISGINVLDKDEIKESFTGYDCPVLCPRPNEFITAPQVVSASFGTGTSHQMDVTYNLTYRYFHAPVGQGDLVKTWSDMVDGLFLIFYAIATNDAITGLIDLQITNITQFGEVQDGAGNGFHGCDITMRILEHIN